MRNSRQENLCEHSMEVAMIAHALCLIGNIRFGRELDADRAAVVGLYHDSSEIITGDMPTPVKYYSDDIRKAYKDVEKIAQFRLLEKLPDDLRDEYRKIFDPGDSDNEKYMKRLVKAADKISALIKCLEEEKSGNAEFSKAQETTRRTLEMMAEEMPEVQVFMDEFIPAYGKTLDELA